MKEWWQSNDELHAKKASLKRLKTLADRYRAVGFGNSYKDD